MQEVIHLSNYVLRQYNHGLFISIIIDSLTLVTSFARILSMWFAFYSRDIVKLKDYMKTIWWNQHWQVKRTMEIYIAYKFIDILSKLPILCWSHLFFPMLILIRPCISIRKRTHFLSKLALPMPLEICPWNL